MSKPQANDLPDALARVEKAQSQLNNAKRRLSRAEDQVRTAKSDVSDAESEVKDSTSALETLIKRSLGQAMRKGGSSAAMALGEVISKFAEEEKASGPSSNAGGGDQLPLGNTNQAASE